jgi:hypothetical protein
MRNNPFLGQYTLKIPRDKEMGGNSDVKWYIWWITLRWIFKGVPIRKPIPKEDHLLGHIVNHQGETRKKA